MLGRILVVAAAVVVALVPVSWMFGGVPFGEIGVLVMLPVVLAPLMLLPVAVGEASKGRRAPRAYPRTAQLGRLALVLLVLLMVFGLLLAD